MGRIASGWPEFDCQFGGLLRPGVVAVGSTDTCGSRTLAELLILARAAVGQGSVVFTLGVPPEQEYLEHLACFRTGIEPVDYWVHARQGPNRIDSHRHRRTLADAESRAFQTSLGELAEVPVLVDDEFPNSVAGIGKAMGHIVRRKGVELGAVLYPELLDEAPELPERDFYSGLVEGVGKLALDLDATFVLACLGTSLPGISMELTGNRTNADTLDVGVCAQGQFSRYAILLATGLRAFLSSRE